MCLRFQDPVRLAVRIAAPLLLATLASCGNYYVVPKEYTGPTAVIRGTSKSLNAVKGESFKVAKIDGKTTLGNPVATPRGGGIVLSVRETEQKVMVAPMTLTLVGSTIYAADGVALADSLTGGARHVNGDVSFTPEAGGEYRVKGSLGKDYCAVWLEEEKSGKVVTPKIEKR